MSCPPQLDIMEPKVPDDIYKTHLENNSESISAGCVCLVWLVLEFNVRYAWLLCLCLSWIVLTRVVTSVLCAAGFGGSGSQVDSARMNLASSFVNGFVNAAFGQDKLLTDDGNKWLYKNKDHGKRQHSHKDSCNFTSPYYSLNCIHITLD